MRIILASRKSDLARIQAYRVGEALLKKHPHLEVIYQFRESLGDKNLSDPLWQMPEKGVFTQDFHQDLVEKKADLVVHSWKDLPTEVPPGTEIAATMKRADMRDLFLFKKNRLDSVNSSKVLKIYSSSPRRAYNLEKFFKQAYPSPLTSVVFETVRGNVPTRLQKMLAGDIDGLIVAKAAIDRLLETENFGKYSDEFFEVRAKIRKVLSECFFVVLPLYQNPAAAAQGALAIEIAEGREDIKLLLKSIHDQDTFDAVVKEREILSGLGGGCHQKIGVSCLKRSFGDLTIVRAFTDQGKIVDSVSFQPKSSLPTSGGKLERNHRVSKDKLFPFKPEEQSWFDREFYKDIRVPTGPLMISKAMALPEESHVAPNTPVWVSGWETWVKLAKRGVWVTGSMESLGEEEDPRLNLILNAAPKWTKLSHEDGATGIVKNQDIQTLATYKLISKEKMPNLEGKTHFYWMSGTSFSKALEKYPWIKSLNHSCGPGNTYHKLRSVLGAEAKIVIYPSHALWLKDLLKDLPGSLVEGEIE